MATGIEFEMSRSAPPGRRWASAALAGAARPGLITLAAAACAFMPMAPNEGTRFSLAPRAEMAGAAASDERRVGSGRRLCFIMVVEVCVEGGLGCGKCRKI